MKKLIPVTRDQEFMAEMLAEMKKIRQLLASLIQGGDGAVTCAICGRTFSNKRALRAHMRVHKGE